MIAATGFGGPMLKLWKWHIFVMAN